MLLSSGKQSKSQDMGEATTKVFAGNVDSEAMEKLYAETPQFFATYIKDKVSIASPLTLADIGSASGEMMANLRVLLPEYDPKVIAVDISEKLLTKNSADEKYVANVEHLPFESVDVAVMRYVLQWNDAEGQRNILKEISTHVSKFALVEHAGADPDNTEKWRSHMSDLLSGKKVPKLKRDEYFFSTKLEVESWMGEQGIRYEALRHRRVDNLAEVFIARWNLGEDNALKVRQILGEKNYVFQTDWVIFPSHRV